MLGLKSNHVSKRGHSPINLAAHLRQEVHAWWWGWTRVSWTFPQATQHLAAMALSQPQLKALSMSPVEQNVAYTSSMLNHWSAIDEASLVVTRSLSQSPVIVAALLVDLQFALWVLLPTPLRQTLQGHLSEFLRTSRPMPTMETRNLVFFMLIRISLICIPVFHALELGYVLFNWIHDEH